MQTFKFLSMALPFFIELYKDWKLNPQESAIANIDEFRRADNEEIQDRMLDRVMLKLRMRDKQRKSKTKVSD